MADLKNKVIGGFQVLQEIQAGSGSQGTVYKAICVDAKDGIVPQGTVVALKVMAVQDEGRKQWKRLEKRTADLARLDSPNVVKYYGCFSEAGLFNDVHVVVQEFLQGETLKERLARCPSGLDVDEALIVADAALTGLVHTSRCGIVHRDIKPGNIFLCDDGTVKLIDFEIARQNGGTTTSSAGNIRGSFDYMAPDFTDAEFHGDVQSDVFSMGVVLHEMLTGKTPYQRLEGDDKQANFAFLSRWARSLADGSSPIHVSSRINRLLAHTEDVMSRSLSPRRENRYADFATFREGLKAIRFRNLRNGQNVYQMLQFIGKGGFGEVFKARLRQTGQLVAVKHLLKANYAERFYREAKIMKKLHDPCFVQFVDFFMMDAGNSREAFLVMAFLEGMPGSSLRDAIKSAGEEGIPRKDLFVAFERYARGLQVMHAEGIFHRDIKPSNLYFPAGHPEAAAIMDLGIARDVNGTATHGQVPGTLDYMPPEVVVTDNRGDGGMDIYALGLCFYEALTTKTAFPRLPGGTAAYAEFFERAKTKRKPTFDDPAVQGDRELRDLLTEMTEPELSLRMRDAGILVSRIRKLRKDRFPEAADDERADEAFTSETSEPQANPDAEPIAETVVLEGATQGTAATQWGDEKLAALERERKIVQTRHREMQIRTRRRAGRLVALLGIVLSVGAGGFFFWGPVREHYADVRLDDVIGEYQTGNGQEAQRKEAAWRAQWDPESFNWLKLDRKAFSALVGKLDTAKKRMLVANAEREKASQIARERQSALETIDGCRSASGKLDEAKFAHLDGWTVPEAVADDVEVGRRLTSLGGCVEAAVRENLSVQPPLTRGARIRRAKEILANPWAAKTLGKGERDRLANEVEEVSAWCVGVVKNNCETDIQLDGRTIPVGRSCVVVYKDGHSEKGVVSRSGYKPIPLPTRFDGMTFEVDDSSFVIKPIKFSMPKFGEGLRLFLKNHEYSGGEDVELEPGSYTARYVRDEKMPNGEKMYKDYLVEFSVTANADVKIPDPGNWEKTDQYAKYLSSPVVVEIPRLDEDVVCRVDGTEATGKVKIVPGKHQCVYEKKDYHSQTNSFDVIPGREMSLSGPRSWKPTEDLKKLRDAVKLAELGSWAAVDEAIQGVTVVAPENVKELKSLGDKVADWKQQEADRIRKEKEAAEQKLAAERKEVKDEFENLLALEPITGRRNRIEKAKKLLQAEKTRLIFAKNEIDEWKSRVQEEAHWVVGRIKNDCDFRFSAADMAIPPGESRVIKYDDRQFQGVVVRARGYVDRKVAKELDGTDLTISRGQWTMSDVWVKIEGATKGVKCVFNGEQVNGEFKVKPGSYSLVFKRDGYESQSFDFTAKLCDGCTVTVPREWSPLPVDVSVPTLDDDVKCYLGTSQVSKSVRLTPGKSYEFRYQKDDCEDQRVRVLVEAGTSTVVPGPSVWVDVADVKSLGVAEQLISEGKLDEAAQKVEGVKLKSSRNLERLRVVKDKIQKATALKESVSLAQGAILQEDWYECIRYYHVAKENGYVLNAADRANVETAFAKGMEELKAMLKKALHDINVGRTPIRDPGAIRKDMRQLNEWYVAIRK